MNELCIEAPPRRRWLRTTCVRLFQDYNPFYLLSAMCMLLGLFSLNGSLDWSPIPAHNLLWLIAILNLYEMLLIGLGIFLARRGLMRDAGTLFVLEAVFLVDTGFLNAEIFSFNFSLGLVVNIAMFVLAFIKVGAVFRGLGVPLSDQRFPLILAQVLILLAMPGFFAQAASSSSTQLSPLAIYAVWWVVGFIPIIYLLLHRDPRGSGHRALIGTFVILPAISILAHLCTANWVYHVRWYSANCAPLFLGLAVAIGESDDHVRNLALRMRLQLLLPVVAIALAVGNPSQLFVEMGDFFVGPMRLILLASVLVYLHGLILHRHPYFGIAGAVCLGAAGLGDGPAAMSNNVAAISRTTSSTLWRLIPRTVAQWGIISLLSSYVLLAFGFLLSLLRQPSSEPNGSSLDISGDDAA